MLPAHAFESIRAYHFKSRLRFLPVISQLCCRVLVLLSDNLRVLLVILASLV